MEAGSKKLPAFFCACRSIVTFVAALLKNTIEYEIPIYF